ncbi:hypothetical protein [Arcobacter sp. CECT 8985]|uniref:hypothetical protein n=1 Tax=Arcobacter sp. CECT 8985 TaxID=1935424 RepID=UPI00100AAC26|nr:hypothetical protein [Arcobacter sp. CECT 8985]RXJ86189.1 hypothetical protein CRU93_09540 [Arcobacter sp. CECT 8985]
MRIKSNFVSSYKKVVLSTFLLTSSVFATTNISNIKIKEDCTLKSATAFRTYCYEKEFKEGNFTHAEDLIQGLSRYDDNEKVKKYLKILQKKNKLDTLKYLYGLSKENKELLNDLKSKSLDMKYIKNKIRRGTDELNYYYKKVLSSKRYDKYVDFAELIYYNDKDKAYNLLKIAAKNNNAKAAYTLYTNKYFSYVSSKQAKNYLKKAAKLGNLKALDLLFKKDYKLISTVKKLKSDKLIKFYEKNNALLKYNDKKYILNKLLKEGTPIGIFLKLNSIEMHKYGFNELIQNIVKKYPSSKFLELRLPYKYRRYQEAILEAYYKNKDIPTLLTFITYGNSRANKAKQYLKSLNSNKISFLLARAEAKGRDLDSAISILEKLSNKNYKPAKRLLLSLYLKRKNFDKYDNKIAPLAKELSKEYNFEAIGYKLRKIGSPRDKDKLTNDQFKVIIKDLKKLNELGFSAARQGIYEVYRYILKNRPNFAIYKDIKKEVNIGIKKSDPYMKRLRYYIK